MNICILHRYPVSEIKGTNPSFYYFLQELVNKNHKIFVITFADKNDNYSIKGFKFCPLNFQFNRKNNIDKWIKSLLFILIVPFKVYNLNLRYKLDLVYCDDSLPFYAYFVKLISGIPGVMRLGDLQTAYLFYERVFLGKLIYQLLHFLEKITWKNIDKIIAISESFKNFLIQEGISPDKISVVEESIDIDEFCKNTDKQKIQDIREKFNLQDKLVIMFHGLISKIKGVDILLKSTPYILKEFPEVKIMIVGDGPDLNRLKKLSVALGISSSVIFTGWVPFAQIPHYITVCDIGVPIRSSNLGNNFVVTTAFLQYAIMSKPVIAPRLLACIDVFKYIQKPFLFDPENPKELSEQVTELLKNLNLSREIGERNRDLVSSRFSAPRVAQELYSALLAYKKNE